VNQSGRVYIKYVGAYVLSERKNVAGASKIIVAAQAAGTARKKRERCGSRPPKQNKFWPTHVMGRRKKVGGSSEAREAQIIGWR